MPLLMPDLRTALVDPLPEVRSVCALQGSVCLTAHLGNQLRKPQVRATAARALGSLLRGMGEAIGMQELLSWLLATLKSEVRLRAAQGTQHDCHAHAGERDRDVSCAQGSSVERSGAAQGLAEVVAVLGPAHLQALLPNVLAACVSRNSYVREGHLTLFKFLPLATPDAFQVHQSTRSLEPICAMQDTALAAHAGHTCSIHSSNCGLCVALRAYPVPGQLLVTCQ